MKDGWKGKSNSSTKDEKGQVSGASPELKKAINQHIQSDPEIQQSIKKGQGVVFKVKGGQLIAKNSLGKTIYQGAPGEFRGHADMTVSAKPEPRRLNEVLMDRESLKEKQKLQGRGQVKLALDKGSEGKPQAMTAKQRNERNTVKRVGQWRRVQDVAAAPVTLVGGAAKGVIVWGKTPANAKSQAQDLGHDRGR